jgi:hypothetical protein
MLEHRAMQAFEALPWYPNSQSPLLHGIGMETELSWIMCSSWHPGSHVLFSMGTELSCTGRRAVAGVQRQCLQASMSPPWTAINSSCCVLEEKHGQVTGFAGGMLWWGRSTGHWCGNRTFLSNELTCHQKTHDHLVIWNPMLNRLRKKMSSLDQKQSDWTWHNNAGIVQTANSIRSLLNAPCYKRGKNHTIKERNRTCKMLCFLNISRKIVHLMT